MPASLNASRVADCATSKGFVWTWQALAVCQQLTALPALLCHSRALLLPFQQQQQQPGWRQRHAVPACAPAQALSGACCITHKQCSSSTSRAECSCQHPVRLADATGAVAAFGGGDWVFWSMGGGVLVSGCYVWAMLSGSVGVCGFFVYCQTL